MTENYAIKFIGQAVIESGKALEKLQSIKSEAERIGKIGEYYANLDNCVKEIEACRVAMIALSEIQTYRAIGTVEEIQKKMEELERWHTDRINENIKNPFAYTSTSICHNCDHKDEYIEELESEVSEYKTIGTIDEFKVLKDKNEQIPIIHGKAELELHDKEIRNKAIDEFVDKFSLVISESIIWGMLVDSDKDNSFNDTAEKIVDYVIDTVKKTASLVKGGANE